MSDDWKKGGTRLGYSPSVYPMFIRGLAAFDQVNTASITRQDH